MTTATPWHPEPVFSLGEAGGAPFIAAAAGGGTNAAYIAAVTGWGTNAAL
jgi:hypothetical protein